MYIGLGIDTLHIEGGRGKENIGRNKKLVVVKVGAKCGTRGNN